MDRDRKALKRRLIIILLGLLLLSVIILLIGPSGLRTQVYTGNKNLGEGEVVYLENIIFAPVIALYDEAVDFFRPSNFRDFDWPGFGCLFLPNNQARIPIKWLREKSSYCY